MTCHTRHDGPWRPSGEALAQSSQVYHDMFPPLDLEPLSGWLSDHLDIGSSILTEQSAIYSDALYDLSLLIEEVSFEASLAVIYIADLSDELDAASEVGELGLRAGMAREVLALLSPYRAPVPPPEMLFRALTYLSHPGRQNTPTWTDVPDLDGWPQSQGSVTACA